MVSPARSRPSCRPASPCRRPRYRTDRSRWAPRRRQRPRRPVPQVWPKALPRAQAQAWAHPLPVLWRPSEQRPVLARGMPPHTTPPSQPEMSVFATRTTGSLIIVTGRWPEGRIASPGMDSREMLFWEGSYSVAHCHGDASSQHPLTSLWRIKNAGFGFSPWGGARAAFATAHRSIATDPRRRNCANGRRHPAPPSRH
jgi:hypothetical protein